VNETPENRLDSADARQADVDAALRESEDRLRLLASIVENSDDAIITKNLDGIITSWNKGAQRIFGYAAEEVVGKPITILIPAERLDEEPGILDRIRRGERIDHYETVRQRKDGSLLEISLTVSPLRDAGNVIIGASKIARDITEPRRAAKLVATLAGEAEHRTKNVLSSVLAAVHLSNADTPAELKRVIEGRIQALAEVNALFVQSRWTGADVRSIVARELGPYSRDADLRTIVEGPSVVAKPEAAQAIAIAIHELATNAAKYGALSADEGRIRVEWLRTPDNGLSLRWIEMGGPPVRPPAHQGFGSRLMQQMIASQGGNLEFCWRPSGLVCEFKLPV
jgi:PAS domain S-box-containing protein